MAEVPMKAEDFKRQNDDLKQLRNRFGVALKDEEDAMRMYSEIEKLANRIDPVLFGKKVGDIKNQESQHAESFRRMIQTVDRTIQSNEKLIKPHSRYGRR